MVQKLYQTKWRERYFAAGAHENGVGCNNSSRDAPVHTPRGVFVHVMKLPPLGETEREEKDANGREEIRQKTGLQCVLLSVCLFFFF